MAEKFTLERPATRERLIGFVVDGMSDAAAASAISTPKKSVTRQAVTAFRQRHAEAIAARTQTLVAETEHRWIADKDAILGKLEEIYAGLDEVRTTYGFMVTVEAVGEDGERHIYSQSFNGALATQLRGVLSDGADLMGHKPRPDQNVNLRAQVLIREVHGFNPAELG